MDYTAVTQLISSLGFPIAACIYMAVTQQKTEERHRTEVKELQTAIENNTKVMVKICTKLGIDSE